MLDLCGQPAPFHRMLTKAPSATPLLETRSRFDDYYASHQRGRVKHVDLQRDQSPVVRELLLGPSWPLAAVVSAPSAVVVMRDR